MPTCTVVASVFLLISVLANTEITANRIVAMKCVGCTDVSLLTALIDVCLTHTHAHTHTHTQRCSTQPSVMGTIQILTHTPILPPS